MWDAGLRHCKPTYLSNWYLASLFQACFWQDLLPFLASINRGLRMLKFLFTYLRLLGNIVFLGRKDHTWSFLFIEGGLSGLAQDCGMFSRDGHQLRAEVTAWLRLLQVPEIRGILSWAPLGQNPFSVWGGRYLVSAHLRRLLTGLLAVVQQQCSNSLLSCTAPSTVWSWVNASGVFFTCLHLLSGGGGEGEGWVWKSPWSYQMRSYWIHGPTLWNNFLEFLLNTKYYTL